MMMHDAGYELFYDKLYNNRETDDGELIRELNRGYVLFDDKLYYNEKIARGIVEFNGSKYMDGCLLVD